MLTNQNFTNRQGGTAAARTQPSPHKNYIESLRDGREIWIYGERVKELTTHPAFRNTVRMLARLYDACTINARAPSALKRIPEAAGTPTILQSHAQRGRIGRRTRCDCGMGACDIRMDGPQPDYKAAFLATWVRTPSSTIRSRKTPGTGTRKCRRKLRSSIMRS